MLYYLDPSGFSFQIAGEVKGFWAGSIKDFRQKTESPLGISLRAFCFLSEKQGRTNTYLSMTIRLVWEYSPATIR